MHLKEEMVSVPWDPGILLQRCRLAGPLVLSSRCPAGSLISRALELCAEQRPDTGSRPVLSQGSYFVPGPCLPGVSRPWDVHLSTYGSTGRLVTQSPGWCEGTWAVRAVARLPLQVYLGCFRFFSVVTYLNYILFSTAVQ